MDEKAAAPFERSVSKQKDPARMIVIAKKLIPASQRTLRSSVLHDFRACDKSARVVHGVSSSFRTCRSSVKIYKAWFRGV